MRRPFLALLLALAGLTAADAPVPGKAGAGAYALPALPEVEGVSKEDLMKFRRAAGKSALDPEVKAAREKLQELRQQAEFAGDDEKKAMRGEFEAAVDRLVAASRTAIAKADPSLSKETIAAVSDAIEKQQRNRVQDAAKKSAATSGKAFPGAAEAKPAVRDPQADKKTAPPAPGARGPVQVPQVDGVSAADTEKFKVALMRAYRDEAWKEGRTKLQELGAKTQFLTGSERADMQPEFEKTLAEMRKAMRAAIAKADPSLDAEVIAKIADAMEQNLRGRGK